MAPITSVRAACLTVSDYFSQTARHQLPLFQRAYVWGEDQVKKLVGDVEEVSKDPARARPYGLGHITDADGDEPGFLDLVDGYQRTMTLMMILACLRDQAATAAEKERYDAMLWLPASSGQEPRLLTQSNVRDVFRDYVLRPGATEVEPPEAGPPLSIAEQRIVSNRNVIRERLAEMTPFGRQSFARTLTDTCFVVVVSFADAETAWEMVKKEQETGVDHHAVDTAKHTLVGAMPNAQQADATEIWENWQGRLGHERMEHLLHIVRSLHFSRRSSKPIIVDLNNHFGLARDGLTFMRETLSPAAAGLYKALNREIGTADRRTAISTHLETISWMSQPAAFVPIIRWLEVRGEDDPEAPEFFFHLDRLVWFLRMAGIEPSQQERRMAAVARAIGPGVSAAEITAFRVDLEERPKALANLRAHTFERKHYSDTVLRRISLILGSDPGPIHYRNVTIEHVLPQNPKQGSNWLKLFRNKDNPDRHASRLGNLTFLTREQNQAADRHDWAVKQPILATSGFVLSEEAAKTPEWTPQSIRQRTEEMIAILLKGFRM